MDAESAGKGLPLLMVIAACLAACASPSIRGDAAARRRAPVDALLPAGRSFYAFDFTRARYRKLPFAEGGGSAGVCRLLDSLSVTPGEDAWLALPSPSRPFSPMQAAWGPAGNFFLLDRVGARLELYDTNAQFLSGAPLPPDLRGRNLDGFQVFYGRDGTFWFVNRDEGVARQYAELRAFVDQGDWRLRNSVRLPVGSGACLWEPFLPAPCCLASGGAICFDAYFNPAGPWKPGARGRSGLDVFPAPGGREWIVELDGGPGCSSAPICYSPGRGLLSACPEGPGAHPE
jgi:hypothetical protein